MATTLTFLNHACFMLETPHSVLLVDPWLEGRAFYDGWALLDQTTTNAELYDTLKALSHKQLWVWFSHEHPDHFAVPFVRGLSAQGLKPTVLYQATLDTRVGEFVKKRGLEYRECADGVCNVLEPGLELVVHAHESGDSFAVISAGGRRILNLNDCVVSSKNAALDIARRAGGPANPIDLLLTQFGYANWVGNEADRALRQDAAREKLERIAIQIDALRPASVVPFASFSYFCHSENAYMNDVQNAPSDVRAAESLARYQGQISFLKPRDAVDLETSDWRARLQRLSLPAEQHWNQLSAELARAEVPSSPRKLVPPADLLAEFSGYRASIEQRLGPLPKLLEQTGFLRPLRVLIDQQLVLRLSYVAEPEVTPYEANGGWDVGVSSDVLRFVLKNEFGFDTIHVSGRLRVNHAGLGRKQVMRFFKPQVLARHGYGLKRAAPTARMLGGYLVKNVGQRVRATLQGLRSTVEPSV